MKAKELLIFLNQYPEFEMEFYLHSEKGILTRYSVDVGSVGTKDKIITFTGELKNGGN